MWRWRLYIGVCIAALSACSGSIAATPQATLTLIASTSTPEPTPVSVTRTPDTAAIAPGTVVQTGTIPVTASSTVGSQALIHVDPVAAELAAIAQRRVATDLGVEPSRIRVITIEAVRWPDSSLGCPQLDQDYVAVQIDGYRIVLRTGDDTFVFHTDFDRIIPCPEALEAVPSATSTTP
jgi:hypothetical protein